MRGTSLARAGVMAITAWFDEPTASTEREVGAKAAQLGELGRAGIAVPSGFVITTDALRAFLAEPRLASTLKRICSAAEDDEFDHLADVLVGLIRTRDVPAPIAKAICTAARALGDEPLLAVRASPDTRRVDPHVPDMTVAVLDVEGDDALLDAVRTCWASMFSSRVLHRQRRAGLLDCDSPSGGVIVQKMIDADKSGIAFSVEPRSGNPFVIEIDSTFGESEPLLTGLIDPDCYLVDKNTLEVVQRGVGDKRVELVHDEEHAQSRLRFISTERARAASLTENEVRAVAALARRTEEHFHEPRGIEFIISGSMLLAIETRPVAAYRAVHSAG